MAEREVLSIGPATSTFKGPNVDKDIPTELVLHVIYSDGTNSYRCSVCEKEWASFGSAYAHYTHHARTRESYLRGGTPKKRKTGNTVVDKVQSVLSSHIYDITFDIAEALKESSESELLKLNEKVTTLTVKLAEEHSARVRAEKDLAKIKNLFK